MSDPRVLARDAMLATCRHTIDEQETKIAGLIEANRTLEANVLALQMALLDHEIELMGKFTGYLANALTPYITGKKPKK